MSFADVAQVLGVSKSSVWSYYHQERAPSGQMIARLGTLLRDRAARLRDAAREIGAETAVGQWRSASATAIAAPAEWKPPGVEPLTSASCSTYVFARALWTVVLSQVDFLRHIEWHRLTLWRLRTGRAMPSRSQFVALEVALLARAEMFVGIAKEISDIRADAVEPLPSREPTARVRELILRAMVVQRQPQLPEPLGYTTRELSQRTGLSRPTVNRAIAWLRIQPNPEIEQASDHRVAHDAHDRTAVWRLTAKSRAHWSPVVHAGASMQGLTVDRFPIGAPPKLTSDQRDAVRAARNAGVPRDVVARDYSISPDTVSRYCKGLCTDSRGRRVGTEARAAATARIDAGAHVANVASVLGVQVRSVERWYDGRTVPMQDRVSAIAEIRSGEPVAILAQRLGVLGRAISRWERCIEHERRERNVAIRRVASGERMNSVARDLGRARRTVERWYDGRNLPAAERTLAVSRVVHGEPIGIVAAETGVPERAILRWHNTTLGRDFRNETAMAWLAGGVSRHVVSREFHLSRATVRRLHEAAKRTSPCLHDAQGHSGGIRSHVEDTILSAPTARVLADIAAAPEGRLLSNCDRLEEWQADAVLDLLMNGSIYRYAIRDGYTSRWVFGLIDPTRTSDGEVAHITTGLVVEALARSIASSIH